MTTDELPTAAAYFGSPVTFVRCVNSIIIVVDSDKMRFCSLDKGGTRQRGIVSTALRTALRLHDAANAANGAAHGTTRRCARTPPAHDVPVPCPDCRLMELYGMPDGVSNARNSLQGIATGSVQWHTTGSHVDGPWPHRTRRRKGRTHKHTHKHTNECGPCAYRSPKSRALSKNTAFLLNWNAASRPPSARMVVSMKLTLLVMRPKSMWDLSHSAASSTSLSIPMIHSVSSESNMVMPMPGTHNKQQQQ